MVGVERTGTDPSQVGFFASHDVASVDDLDLPPGKTALVWVLRGRATGKYGVKGSAEQPASPSRPTGARSSGRRRGRCAGFRSSSRSALAALLAPTLLARLERAGVVRENYRGLVLPAASGTLIVLAALLALGPLAALEELADADTLAPEVGRRAGVRDRRRGARARSTTCSAARGPPAPRPTGRAARAARPRRARPRPGASAPAC